MNITLSSPQIFNVSNQTAWDAVSNLTNHSSVSSGDTAAGLGKLIAYTFNQIAEVAFTYTDHPTLLQIGVYFLAILGLCAVVYGAFNQIGKAIRILFKVFIAIPLILVLSLSNRRKRAERLKAWGEVREGLKGKGKIPRRHWILWLVLRVLLPACLIGGIIWIELTGGFIR
jgi:hypothetical protein